DGCSEVEGSGMTAMADGADWHLIPRNHAASGPMVRATGVLLQATSTTTETMLVSSVYARPEPALAVRADGFRLLAYVADDANDPDGRHTEIRTRIWDGSSWSGDDVTDDQQPDFAPAVTFDGSGNGLVVWERSTLATDITPTLDITFAQSLEVVARTWVSSTATWGSVVTLTNNSLMDYAPRLSAGNDGSVMALWQTNDGTDILGTAAHPLTFTYALWDSGSWITPTAAAITGLHDVVGTAFAAYSSTQAALVYAVDADGLLTTTNDSDLYYATFNGVWSAPTRLTNDTITDTTPALAYDGTGNLHLLWLRGGDLVWLENSWTAGNAQTVRAASTEAGFMGFTLNRDPAGNLAVVWQGTSDDGANLTYSIYDAANDSWGADNTLMNDADVEAAHSPAFGSDGTLYLAYQRIKTEFVTRTFAISPTASFTVTNFAQPGQSDLLFLAHTIGRDLTFAGLTITPANPAPGQAVTLTAVLRNAGDLAVVDPQVTFYDGATPIVTRTLAITLAAGYTATAQTNWTVPSPAAAHTLKAVADPNGQVTENDETNNEITLQTTLPDLQVEALYTINSSEAITATARLVNAGVLTAAAPFSVAFRAADPLTGTLLGAVAVGSSLGVGEQVTVTLTLTDTASLAGLGDLLWAIADAGETVTETDEGNNNDYARLAVLPDLTLTAADIAGSGPVVVTVRNAGVVTATAPVVVVRQGGPGGAVVYSGTLSTLGPGDSDTVTLTSMTGTVKLWAYADPDHLIAEGDESNNLAVRKIATAYRLYLPLVLRNYAP
ncbi:MAG: CARDB domain-containing protein, partial [Chloroflexota bacterium]|nr:CARDB domain-containing protein [Chloroflexota bacterium]